MAEVQVDEVKEYRKCGKWVRMGNDEFRAEGMEGI